MEEKEQRKRARRNQKGRLTLAMKEMIHEVQREETDVAELRRLMLRVDQIMESVEEAHLRLADVIESDEEYANEQEWMERVTSDYRETVRRARMLLNETETEHNVQDQNMNSGSTTERQRNFVSQPMAKRSVRDIPGIGQAYGRVLGAEGYDTAEKVFSMFLLCDRDPSMFKRWLRSIVHVKPWCADACYEGLNLWYQNFF